VLEEVSMLKLAQAFEKSFYLQILTKTEFLNLVLNTLEKENYYVCLEHDATRDSH
jgi:hypothetical protein